MQKFCNQYAPLKTSDPQGFSWNFEYLVVVNDLIQSPDAIKT